jgi:hypothetical protein
MRKINLAATPDFAIQIVAQIPFRLSRYTRPHSALNGLSPLLRVNNLMRTHN